MSDWTISVATLDVPNTVYKHAVIVLKDGTGAVRGVINGGPRLPNGELADEHNLSTYADGSPLGGKAVRYSADYTGSYAFYDRSLPEQTLVSGTEAEIEGRWAVGISCVDAINNSGFRYQALPSGNPYPPSNPLDSNPPPQEIIKYANSNTVAATLIGCMVDGSPPRDLLLLFMKPGPFPGMQRLVLSRDIINSLREANGLSPINWRHDREYIPGPKCFLAGTPIAMADGSQKPIEAIKVGDRVMAFDEHAHNGLGKAVPRKVTRVMSSIASEIIELRGLRVTPNHRFLSDGGAWIAIADCLIQDRGIVEERDGKPVLVRARTGAAIGSLDDVVVKVVFKDRATGKPRLAHVRAGIPCMGRKREDGAYELQSLLTMVAHFKGAILPDGNARNPDGSVSDAVWWTEGSTPIDAALMQDWVVKLDGQPYTPPWIAEIAVLDKNERLVINGGFNTGMSVYSSGPSNPLSQKSKGRASAFSPQLISGGISSGGAAATMTNRKARRKAAALTRVP